MKKILQYVYIYILMILIFIILMILVSLIPSKWIEKNVRSSAEFLMQEGEFKFIDYLVRVIQLDSYTDALMIDNAYSIDSHKPIESAILVRENYIPGISKDITRDCLGEHIKPVTQVEELYNLVNQKPEQSHEYARYWHGYLVYLRPLLLILDYQKIRILIAIILYGLVAKLLYELWKKVALSIAIAVLISYICVDVQLLFLSLQSMITFLIATIFSIIIIKQKEKIKDINILFFIIGGVTCFFDFFSTPVITLGIPLIIYLSIMQANTTLKEKIISIIKTSLIWLLGYVTIWASKWVITDIIYRRDIIVTSIKQFLYRSNNSEMSLFEIYIKNIGRVNVIFLELVSIVFYFIITRKNNYKISNIKQTIPYCIIMLIPLAWYTIVRQHSGMHAFFTYRSMVIFILGVEIGIIKLLGLDSKNKGEKNEIYKKNNNFKI